jgi:transaldolase
VRGQWRSIPRAFRRQLLRSRIDTAVDIAIDPARPVAGRLDPGPVASATLAYRAFQDAFTDARWQRVAAAGASVQRCLCASTSTEDPAYRDVRYVEELIGRKPPVSRPKAAG